jgi:hypothetical protein
LIAGDEMGSPIVVTTNKVTTPTWQPERIKKIKNSPLAKINIF